MNKVAFVTTFCPHHRKKTFELIASHYKTDFYFFSAGDEWYWQQQHGIEVGDFHFEYLPGIRLGKTRFTPTLLWKLWWKEYNVYVKCINGRFALPITYLIARLKRKPFILWTGLWTRVETPFHRLFFPVTRYFYRHADAIVVYGEHVKRYLVSEGVLAERIFVAAHAVDNPSFNQHVSREQKIEIYKKLNVPTDQKIILYLGRLEKSKGLEYLLEAFANSQRSDAVLVLAGAGSELLNLQKLAQELHIEEHIRFVGYVAQEQAVYYYALAWVYVLPSITLPEGKEPWGLVVNEAFNQGVPVIATHAVGAAAGGLVEDGVNGFVVPERNSDALANTLSCLLDSPKLREDMADNAYKKIQHWDNERMVLGFRNSIEYVMSGHR